MMITTMGINMVASASPMAAIKHNVRMNAGSSVMALFGELRDNRRQFSGA